MGNSWQRLRIKIKNIARDKFLCRFPVPNYNIQQRFKRVFESDALSLCNDLDMYNIMNYSLDVRKSWITQ